MSRFVRSAAHGIAGLLVVAALPACISARLAPTVVKYNKGVESAQNEMLLLNIVRAAKRKPMYLVDISKITGSISFSSTATLTVPFGSVNGPGTGTNYSLAPGATYAINPTFDVNLLNTQDFMKGFLEPVTPDQLQYFLRQGWRPELLIPLFVLQVDLPDGTTLVNHPGVADEEIQSLDDFEQWVRGFTQRGLQMVTYETPEELETIGPPVEIPDTATWAKVIGEVKDGYRLEQVNEDRAETLPTYQLEQEAPQGHTDARPRQALQQTRKVGPPVTIADAEALTKIVGVLNDHGLTLKEVLPKKLVPTYQLERVKMPKRTVSLLVPEIGKDGHRIEPQPTLKQTPCAAPPATSRIVADEGLLHAVLDNTCVTLHLRSPEALLYYLGELVRTEYRGLKPPETVNWERHPDTLPSQTNPKPLFVARRWPSSATESGGPKSCTEWGPSVTDEEGDTFYIPRAVIPQQDDRQKLLSDSPTVTAAGCDAGMSYDVLTVMTQLIALHKSVKDAPTTPLVRAIGP